MDNRFQLDLTAMLHRLLRVYIELLIVSTHFAPALPRRGQARRDGDRRASRRSRPPCHCYFTCALAAVVSGLSCCTPNDSVTSTYVHSSTSTQSTDPKISRPLENKGVASSLSAPAEEAHHWCRWADLAQFKRGRGTKDGGSTARGGKRGAARQQECRTVGSQSVNLTLNVNVSGGQTPGAPPDAAPTPRTGRTVPSTVTTPTTPPQRTGLTLTVARCLSASLLAPYHTVLPSKKSSKLDLRNYVTAQDRKVHRH